MRTAFINTLQELAQKDKSLFLLTADLGFRLFDDFRALYPDRFINIGVAEPNMIGVAAGLALSGKNVFCYSMAPFLTMRAFEQIRVDLCYQKLGVKLVGVGGGLFYGLEGMTHHAIEDLAIMRSLPNMTVIAPGDPFEAAEAVRAASSFTNRPAYLRLAGNNDPVIHSGNIEFTVGKAIVLKKGHAVSIIAVGTMLPLAKQVSDSLAKQGVTATLVSMHTLKPLDSDLIRELSSNNGFIFTVEEHSEIGGLGTAVAETLLQAGWQGTFRKFALPDEYSEDIGHAPYLREKAGLSVERISTEILGLLKNTVPRRDRRRHVGV